MNVTGLNNSPPNGLGKDEEKGPLELIDVEDEIDVKDPDLSSEKDPDLSSEKDPGMSSLDKSLESNMDKT